MDELARYAATSARGPRSLAAVDFLGDVMFGESFPPLEAGPRPTASLGGTATELADNGDVRATGLERAGRRGDRARAGARGRTPLYCLAEARFLAERLRELPRTRASTAATWSSCCARSPTWTRSRTRSTGPACAPYVVGGRGYWSQQQVEDVLRLLAVVANPLDDELLFGALASPACGVSADAAVASA